MNKIFRFALVAAAAACTLGFASCSDDDDDDDNNSSTPVNVDDVVGTWKKNASESTTSSTATIAGKEVNLDNLADDDDEEGEEEDDEDSSSLSILDSTVVFNADGTLTSTTGAKIGTYSISGSDLTLSVTEDGETQTIKKGATVNMGVGDVTVKTCSIAVNGDKMTITAVMEGSVSPSSFSEAGFDLSAFGGLGNISLKYSAKTVYDRLK